MGSRGAQLRGVDLPVLAPCAASSGVVPRDRGGSRPCRESWLASSSAGTSRSGRPWTRISRSPRRPAGLRDAVLKSQWPETSLTSREPALPGTRGAARLGRGRSGTPARLRSRDRSDAAQRCSPGEALADRVTLEQADENRRRAAASIVAPRSSPASVPRRSDDSRSSWPVGASELRASRGAIEQSPTRRCPGYWVSCGKRALHRCSSTETFITRTCLSSEREQWLAIDPLRESATQRRRGEFLLFRKGRTPIRR